MASAGYVRYDPATRRFALPPEHAPVLAQEGGPVYFGGLHQMLLGTFGVVDQLSTAFMEGGGVPQPAYSEDFWAGMERFTVGWFENLLLQEWIPAMPRVRDALERGAAVADVGCNRGRALIKLARAFPRSRFVGYDIFQPAILPATERAAAAGVSDRIRFEHRDVSKGLPEQFDVITTFDVIHDAVDPLGLLQAIRQALRPGGTYVCVALHRLIEEFVTGRRQADAAGRAVTTALFTDIVGSTQRAAHLGDAAWRQILDRHDALIREQVALYGGRFIESSGDGTLATFESPSRAIDCALALHEAAKPLGISLRAGLHTGEVELRDDGRVGGLAVHFGARVMAAAQAGEVLVSHTVHGILMGSRHAFAERGVHERKGVPGKWPLYAVRG